MPCNNKCNGACGPDRKGRGPTSSVGSRDGFPATEGRRLSLARAGADRSKRLMIQRVERPLRKPRSKSSDIATVQRASIAPAEFPRAVFANILPGSDLAIRKSTAVGPSAPPVTEAGTQGDDVQWAPWAQKLIPGRREGVKIREFCAGIAKAALLQAVTAGGISLETLVRFALKLQVRPGVTIGPQIENLINFQVQQLPNAQVIALGIGGNSLGGLTAIPLDWPVHQKEDRWCCRLANAVAAGRLAMLVGIFFSGFRVGHFMPLAGVDCSDPERCVLVFLDPSLGGRRVDVSFDVPPDVSGGTIEVEVEGIPEATPDGSPLLGTIVSVIVDLLGA